jgi:hypothetical protein
MKEEQSKNRRHIRLNRDRKGEAAKIAITTLVIMVSVLIALKLSKEMLKELEGMGL